MHDHRNSLTFLFVGGVTSMSCWKSLLCARRVEWNKEIIRLFDKWHAQEKTQIYFLQQQQQQKKSDRTQIKQSATWTEHSGNQKSLFSKFFSSSSTEAFTHTEREAHNKLKSVSRILLWKYVFTKIAIAVILGGSLCSVYNFMSAFVKWHIATDTVRWSDLCKNRCACRCCLGHLRRRRRVCDACRWHRRVQCMRTPAYMRPDSRWTVCLWELVGHTCMCVLLWPHLQRIHHCTLCYAVIFKKLHIPLEITLKFKVCVGIYSVVRRCSIFGENVIRWIISYIFENYTYRPILYASFHIVR